MAEGRPLLELDDVQVSYEGVIRALHGVSLQVPRGSVVALLGANGAGKTTTLQAASGLLGAVRGHVDSGRVLLDGVDSAGLGPRALVRRGVVQVLEGRHCFPHLTVWENLTAGTLGRGAWLGFRGRARTAQAIERVFERFPRLALRRRTPAGLLSGGEQQMLVIGRALLTEPRLLLLDEPSMGLAPLVVQEIFELVRELNRRDGVAVLLAEQNARMALGYADQAYVLESGVVVAHGPASELAARDDVREFYLGLGHEQRRNAGALVSGVELRGRS